MTYTIHGYPVELIDVVQLGDGARIAIRPVLPQDADLHRDFVRSLSASARRFRFMTGMAELPEAMVRQLTSIDYTSHIALVATVIEDGSPRMIAEARYAADGMGGAEFAISIADHWRRHGLGRMLLQRLEHHAARSGLRRIAGTALIDNKPMLTLARASGYAVKADPEDVELAVFVKELRHEASAERPTAAVTASCVQSAGRRAPGAALEKSVSSSKMAAVADWPV